MTTGEIIDGEAVEVGQEVVQYQQASVTLFGSDDPVVVVEKATRVADALADVIQRKELFKRISGKNHVLVEGWTLLGTMLGVFPTTEWTRPIERDGSVVGYEAAVVAVTRSGEVVGRREAMCLRTESRWKNADEYALRSMAQTRATSGALAGPLRFIMTLAGYESTPEPEIPSGGFDSDRPRPVQKEQTVELGKILEHLEQNFPKQEGQLSWRQDIRNFTKEKFGTENGGELTEPQFDEVLGFAKDLAELEGLPFG